MKTLLFVFLFSVVAVDAKLIAKMQPAKRTGDKAVIRIDLMNTFTEKIESARVTVFLIDENGKVVGQSVKWVIGGSAKQPLLAPEMSTSFNFVVPIQKSFHEVKLVCNRIILEGGKIVEPANNFEISK